MLIVALILLILQQEARFVINALEVLLLIILQGFVDLAEMVKFILLKLATMEELEDVIQRALELLLTGLVLVGAYLHLQFAVAFLDINKLDLFVIQYVEMVLSQV